MWLWSNLCVEFAWKKNFGNKYIKTPVWLPALQLNAAHWSTLMDKTHNCSFKQVHYCIKLVSFNIIKRRWQVIFKMSPMTLNKYFIFFCFWLIWWFVNSNILHQNGNLLFVSYNTCTLVFLLSKHRYVNGHAKLHHEESTNHAVCMDCDNLAVFW